ncbi:MAG TPA: phosphatase PAP2 family protein [Thermoplasmata archaeon]
MQPLLATVSVGPDERWFRALNLAGTNAIADAAMVAFTILGAGYVVALLVVPLWWRGHREAAFDLLVLLGIAIVVTEALKFAIGRPRPCEVLSNVRWIAGFGCDTEIDPSFPSGHASRAFALATFVASRFRRRAGGAAFAFAFLVGLSRIYLGVHWPSDVIAGAVLGIALAAAMEWMSRRSDRYRRLRSGVLSKIPHQHRASP